MAAQPQRQRARLVERLHIGDGIALRGHLSIEGHVEVFLPADDRVVRTPEGGERRAVREEEGDRGKLLLRRPVVLIDVADELRPREALALPQRREQLPVLLLGVGELAVLLRVEIEQRLRRIAQQRAAALHAAVQDARKRHIGKVAEDQRVDPAKGHLRQRNIAPPLDIVDDVCHPVFLLCFVSLFALYGRLYHLSTVTCRVRGVTFCQKPAQFSVLTDKNRKYARISPLLSLTDRLP